MRYVTEAALRTAALGGLSIFFVRALEILLVRPDATLALLVLGELVTLSIVLAARPARARAANPVALVSTGCATFYFLFVILDGGHALAPAWLTLGLQASGLLLQIGSKLALGRSFGLLPANRGVVTRGPYRVVRHPIYLGYFISHAGFLFAEFTVRNALLLGGLLLFQALRIREEESLLRRDPVYLDYCGRVRYRLFPGVI